MKANCEFRVAFLATAVLVSGCAQDGTMTTGGLNATPDPACVTLATQIKKLEDAGVPEKVAKAAKKKYKLNSSDLAKVAQLNKANADFQTKCSNMPAKPTVAGAPANADKKAAAIAKQKIAAKKPPPIPVHKPASAPLGAADASAQGQGEPQAVQPALQMGTAAIAPTPQDKPNEAAPQSIETGTVSTAPPRQGQDTSQAAQPSPQSGTAASAPPASGEPEATGLSPQTEAPAAVPPAQ